MADWTEHLFKLQQEVDASRMQAELSKCKHESETQLMKSAVGFSADIICMLSIIGGLQHE